MGQSCCHKGPCFHLKENTICGGHFFSFFFSRFSRPRSHGEQRKWCETSVWLSSTCCFVYKEKQYEENLHTPKEWRWWRIHGFVFICFISFWVPGPNTPRCSVCIGLAQMVKWRDASFRVSTVNRLTVSREKRALLLRPEHERCREPTLWLAY